MELISNYMTDDSSRKMLNELTLKTFGFEFDGWVKGGWFEGDYIPYSFVEDGKMLSNVSANKMHFMQRGVEKDYIQLGTVMTDESYRKQGLARKLIEHVIKTYENECDGFYLFGNLDAVDFYLKNGFKIVKEIDAYETTDPVTFIFQVEGTFHEGQEDQLLQLAMENSDAIEEEIRLCGYFCIITSENMTASRALVQYKGRDISEKLFRSDKTFIGSRSERVQSSQSMSSKIFIEFVALIVRNRIYNLLKEQMLRMESKQKYMTVPAAIRELEKIEMVRRNGGRYKLDHAVTKTQKVILSSFGLDETNISSSAEEISKLLASSQSLMNREEPDDGEEEIN